MVNLAQAWDLGGRFKGLHFAQGRSMLTLPGHIDTSKVGDGTGNSAVEACLSTLANAVSEPPIGEKTEDGINFGHLAAKLLARPTEWMRGSLLTRHIVVAMNVVGHAVLWKQRSEAGRVVGLPPLPPTMVEPGDGHSSLATLEERQDVAAGRGKTITHFEYAPPERSPIRLEVDDVIYLRQDVDTKDLKRGTSKLRTVLREVLQDEEAGLFAAALLANMGIPGVMLIPDLDAGEPGPSKDEADAVAKSFYERFTGPRRGRPLMMTGKVKVEVLSFNPDQMNFEVMRRIPEERISAVTGVPAILAGLGAGLDKATYSNARELREFFTEQTIVPNWELLEEEYTFQLMPDFGGGVLSYDLSEVRALQQDQDALWKRNLEALERGGQTVAEFREAVGLKTLPGTDIFLRSPTVLELTAAGVTGD